MPNAVYNSVSHVADYLFGGTLRAVTGLGVGAMVTGWS